ncbi:hypothetical protein VOM14_20750 [Paraburkholderia sp. MPAMCS5]|uniref:hypothetical protein n=1 Tax=Paraburkholderia sp. MPAMCS5 TaxID=3112563 RepID=UPI002E1997BA|nr:hypothetical protein [Paraburkholderia sp. MPAMCS5]
MFSFETFRDGTKIDVRAIPPGHFSAQSANCPLRGEPQYMRLSGADFRSAVCFSAACPQLLFITRIKREWFSSYIKSGAISPDFKFTNPIHSATITHNP